jgi:hypothetical protein
MQPQVGYSSSNDGVDAMMALMLWLDGMMMMMMMMVTVLVIKSMTILQLRCDNGQRDGAKSFSIQCCCLLINPILCSSSLLLLSLMTRVNIYNIYIYILTQLPPVSLLRDLKHTRAR